MPKRFGDLFDKIFTIDRLFEAYETARRGKRKTWYVMEFERSLGAEIQALHDELHSGEYRPQPYRTFWISEPKPRLISAPAFRDVVAQHAVYAVINPIFDATFIHDSYGCRLGKGTHRASDRVQQFLRQSPPDSYVLQLDIRRFYYSIDRSVLRCLIERRIKDRRLVDVMMMFAEHQDPLGVPIGNLLSQLYALIYLNPLDHFIKRELRAPMYARYVDDFVLAGLTKQRAHEYRLRIEEYAAQTLRLGLSKWSVYPARRGVNFVGFRTWRRCRFVRKRSMGNFSRSLRRGDVDSLQSIMGHALETSSYAHLVGRVRAERPDLVGQLSIRSTR